MSKIKKIVSLILILFLTISININLTMKSVKAGQERSGDWEYSINKDGTISINGYLGNNLDINIPNNIDGKIVTKLGDYAFSNSKIRKVVMPNTINELGDYCFESSHNLSEVVFSNDLTKISNNCFNGCCSLIAIDIPDNITEIGYNAFYGTRLCQVNLPKNLKVIRTEAFAEIGNILSIAIPDSVNCIEENTFYNSDVTIFCNNNSYAKIYAENNNINYKNMNDYNDNVGEINNLYYTIKGNEAIILGLAKNTDTVVIPEKINGKTVTSIHSYAFMLSNIKEITIPNSVKEIEYGCFEGCHELNKVILPNTLTKISSNCFNGCINLFSIDIPDSVIEIENNAFYESGLRNINLSKNLKKIGSNAFCNVYNLISILIPDSVSEIAKDAFNYNDLVLYCNNNSYGNSYAIENHIGHDNPENYENNIFNGLYYTVHDGYVIILGSNSNVKNVTIPDSINWKNVKVINAYSFYYNNNIVSLEVNANLTEINEKAFSNCANLEKANINKEVIKYRNGIFSSCKLLKSVNFNYNIHEITSNMFSGCINLDVNSILTKNKIYAIGDNAFYNCKSKIDENALKDVEIIGEYAFYCNDKITNLNLEEITSIGDCAFWSCTNLGKVKIKNNKYLNLQGKYIFFDCNKCVLISSANSVIEKYAKDNCIKFNVEESSVPLKSYTIKKTNPYSTLSKLKLVIESKGNEDFKYRFVVLKDNKCIYSRGYKKSNYTFWRPKEKGEYTICFKVKDTSGKEVFKTTKFKVS